MIYFIEQEDTLGSLVFCGKRLLLLFEEKKTLHLTLKDWEPYVRFRLPNILSDVSTTITKLVQFVKEPEYRTFLWKYFLRDLDTKKFHQEDDREIARTLAAEGALKAERDPAEGIYSISSPLINAVIIQALIGKRYGAFPAHPLKPDSDILDVKVMLPLALPMFDPKLMRLAPQHMYKQLDIAAGDAPKGTRVPKESVYQMELISILRQWFSSGQWSVTAERNTDSPGKNPSDPKRKELFCDIVFARHHKETYSHGVAIEIVAHERDTGQKGEQLRHGSVEEHLQRAQERYRHIPEVEEVWVINFTLVPPNNSKRPYVWAEDYPNVNVAHVYHDLAWTKCLISFSKTEVIEIPLPQKTNPSHERASSSRVDRSMNQQLNQLEKKFSDLKKQSSVKPINHVPRLLVQSDLPICHSDEPKKSIVDHSTSMVRSTTLPVSRDSIGVNWLKKDAYMVIDFWKNQKIHPTKSQTLVRSFTPCGLWTPISIQTLSQPNSTPSYSTKSQTAGLERFVTPSAPCSSQLMPLQSQISPKGNPLALIPKPHPVTFQQTFKPIIPKLG
eukprot:TRINITY_DN9067_c0_g2_i1.p1 TRINITY_DN9067_c0_g2~~TRINITY_DN9067_c0_g2_i1.p1  ORF type:complete len:557 (-),score=70.03 TRINITY_DN9067_c0_g2_i1:4-1674(-)